MKRIFVFLIIMLFCINCVKVTAQDSSIVDTTSIESIEEEENFDSDYDSIKLVETDTAFIVPVLRSISQDSLLALRKDKAFAYMQYADSFFRHQEDKINDNLQRETIAKPGFFDNIGLRSLYALLAIGLLLWIVWKLMYSNASLFATNKKVAIDDVEKPDPQLPDADELLRIEKAIDARQFRMATRFMFLYTLKKMGEKQIVLPAAQKTNYQYLHEIKNEHCRNAFSQLMLGYEFIWFGEFVPSSQQFDVINSNFKSFWKNWI